MDPSAIPWSIVGNVSVAVMVAMLIFTGWLIPKGTVSRWLEVQQKLVDAERRINDIQAASLNQQRTTTATLLETNSKLVDEYGKTTAYSLQQIQQQAKEVTEPNE